MAKTMLEVKGLTTKYITRFHEDVYAVDHVSLKIEEGKSLGIAGESGCGKSTLALSLMGYYFAPLHYMSGEIIIDGKNISGMDPDAVRKNILGNEIAYIPQAAMNALNPTLRIRNFVEDVIRAHDPKRDKKEIYEMAKARFTELGLPADSLDKHAVEHLVGPVGLGLDFRIQADEGIANHRLHQHVGVLTWQLLGGHEAPTFDFAAVARELFGNHVRSHAAAERVENHLFDRVFFVKHGLSPNIPG